MAGARALSVELRKNAGDVRVNLVEGMTSRRLAERIRRDFPNAMIRISPNRGRDIGGNFALMADLDFANYDIVCLMHTKKANNCALGGAGAGAVNCSMQFWQMNVERRKTSRHFLMIRRLA